jgi:hypothetical protein
MGPFQKEDVQKPSASLQTLLILAALTLACCLAWGWKHRSESVDMALHYTLTEYIQQNWRWPTQAVSRIGEMNWYPPVSHTVAAVVGFALGSSFLGMHIVAVLSAFFVYVVLFRLVRFSEADRTIAATIILVTLLCVFASKSVFFGAELVRNYFYPQMVGEACLFAVVIACVKIRAAPFLKFGVYALVALALGWVYPIAAVQFVGAVLTLRALSIAQLLYSQRRLTISMVSSALALATVLCLAILLHPRFRHVTVVGSGDGWVDVRVSKALIVPESIALLIVTAILAFEFIRGRLGLRQAEPLIALCGGIALASVVQSAAFHILGVGSPYATYKHLFAVSTMLLTAVVVAAIHFVRIPKFLADRPQRSAFACMVFAPAALVALAAVTQPWRGSSLRSFMQQERFAREAMRALPRDALGHTVFKHSGHSAVTQLALSMGILHLPKQPTLALTHGFLFAPGVRDRLIEKASVKYAFISTRDGAPLSASCVVLSAPRGDTTVVRFDCLRR